MHQQDESQAHWIGIQLPFVFKLVHDSGVKVIQVGEDSVEQFCGYNGYIKYLPLRQKYFQPL